MQIGLVNHFNIVIAQSQAAATLRFYRDVLGLKEGFRPNFSTPGWWLYGDGHPVLHVTVRDVAPTRGPTGSVDHIALNAKGLAAMKARLKEHGIAFEEQRVDDNTVHQIFFRDVNGLKIELDYALDEHGAF